MEITARQIATLFKGEILGEPEVTVNRLSKIEEGEPGTLAFLGNPKYLPYLYTTRASVVLVNRSFSIDQDNGTMNATVIRVDDAHKCFAALLEKYHNNNNHNGKSGIEQPSFISKTATIGNNTYVGHFVVVSESARIGNHVKLYPHVYIGDNVVIKDNTVLYSGVKVYHDCVIGENCTIHAGAIIGADGFGFFPDKNSEFKKVVQTGNVVIEDDVEIGANTTVDRATLGSTTIRKGVKLDNLIQVAHNVEIGEHTVIAAQTGIAGSTKIGRECMIGGQVGIIGHLTIANKVKIAAQSGIGSSIAEEGAVVQGSPAFEVNTFRRAYILFRKLPEIQKTLEKLALHFAGKQPVSN